MIKLFEKTGELQKLFPFFLKEMNGHVIKFNVPGCLAIRFFGFPRQEVLGLSDGLGGGFVIIVGHVFLLLV